MANTRDILYRRRQRRIETIGATAAEAATRPGGAGSLAGQDGDARTDGNSSSTDIINSPVIENDGPLTQIIRRMPTKIERRLRAAAYILDQGIIIITRTIYTFWDIRPWREKTAIELEQELEIKERQKIRRLLRREGNLFARRASNSYARMGICYYPPVYARSWINPVKKVKFTNIVAELNAIWLQIDTMRLPPGVDILRCIEDVNILTNLSASLRHHVSGVYDVEKGAWLCIERGRGVRGIPQLVSYHKMMSLKDPNAHGLTIPLGESGNSKRLYRNLRDFPHFLVAGATGRGKTTYLNIILAALIENNTPERVKIVLVDLKGGIEFDMYRGVPHLWKMGGKKDKSGTPLDDEEQIAPDGIVGKTDKVIKLLERMIYEGERRLDLFRVKGVTNIDEYNLRRKKSALSRIVIVFDEWARVALSPDGLRADNLLAEITATYRAVGFHVILATQTPIKRVVSTLIKTNFNARLAFGVPDNVSSMVILDSIKAKGLSPQGRAIFKFGIQELEVQAPLITRPELNQILAEARADGGAVEDEISLLEVFRYSLNQLSGSLAVERLYQHYKLKIGRNALHEKLRSLDGVLVDVDGVEYVVEPGDGGAVPRSLRPFTEEIEQPQPHPPAAD